LWTIWNKRIDCTTQAGNTVRNMHLGGQDVARTVAVLAS
jgi:hypothetical protein